MRSILFLFSLIVFPQQGDAVALPAPGEVSDSVDCVARANQSYALYLPRGYTTERRWPVLYLLDPRGRGRHALDIYRAAAEKHGYILVSSNNSRSDSPAQLNYEAAQALLDDTFRRLSVDPTRIYVGGMSGTARAACDIATHVDGGVSGAILVGAACSDDVRLDHLSPLDVVAVVGREDFNYVEVQEFTDKLIEGDVSHRLIVHDGSHAWHDQAIAEDVVAWLELRAIARGFRSGD